MSQCNSEKNRRILIVDDNRAIHSDFRKVLAQTSADDNELVEAEAALFGIATDSVMTDEFKIDSAYQGQEGLELVRRSHKDGRPYAVAFVDIRMPPGWDGVETIKRIWQEYPDLQVVICTAYSDYSWKMIVDELQQRENLLILKKPFDATEVLQMASALTEKWHLTVRARHHFNELENTVERRTRELRVANEQLKSEVAQRTKVESRLRYDAFHDPLTDLPNRALLKDRLQAAMERFKRRPDEQFAVLFMDLDRFKIVNDSLGHEFGDRLLRAMATRLLENLRSSDSLARSVDVPTIARLGGDEFVVLLDNVRGPHDAAKVANRLLSTLASPCQLGTHEVRTTASIGIVVANSDYVSADEILRDADVAMYQAKAQGGSRFVMFDSSMQTAIQNRLQIENDLRAGIGTDQFYLVYQPIVSVETGNLCGVETLVRWNHPERGLIMPSEFIPIAEETRQILPLGDWILEQSCQQFMRWQTDVPQLAPDYISVNLSRVQLTKQGIVQQIRDCVKQTGMQPEQLQLEVTESLIMEDPARAQERLGALKDAGIRLAIDDFGTGHSSLSCLYEYSLDVLKIDRSFISNFEHGQQYVALANSVVQLATNLSLECVAEGVEESSQAIELLEMGCRYAQGYYYGQPMSPDTLIPWMTNANDASHSTAGGIG